MDGGAFTVFDRSVLVSNGLVHGQVCSQNNSGDYLFREVFSFVDAPYYRTAAVGSDWASY
jgi:hypothetical protein